ncbi:MAG: 30S ribosome-binding factor RbfA [Acholeplasmatales bacterium]|jgi:ribosome-binding factor A|nr:30S ribosome-binding factor RbfA [Acholeplasmatales bacterium]
MRVSITLERLATRIHRELAHIVNEVLGDNKSFGYINIVEVKLTKDLSYATIYYTLLTEDKELIDLAQNTLSKKVVEIRTDLAKKIKDIRKIPDLIFKYDEAIAYGNRIEDIIRSFHKEK